MTSERVRCALVGDEPLVEQCAESLAAHGLEVVLIATTNAMVRDYANEQGIPVVGPGAELARRPRRAPGRRPASASPTCASSPTTCSARVETAINFHDGPLPGYAGLNVTTWALLAGEREHADHLAPDDRRRRRRRDRRQRAVPDRRRRDGVLAERPLLRGGALDASPASPAALAAGTLATYPQPAGEHRMFRRHDRPARVFDPAGRRRRRRATVRALDLGHRLRNTIGSVRWVLGDDVLIVDVRLRRRRAIGRTRRPTRRRRRARRQDRHG